MITTLALLLQAAAPAPVTAIDAERAFARDAQDLGQWAAFRKWSSTDAQMFIPQPVNAHDFLAGREEPPVPVFWWPGASFVSCDGGTSVNTGPWVREFGKAHGYFTTVWRKGDDGWKWVYDGGDDLAQPRAQGGDIDPVTAACDNPPDSLPSIEWRPDATTGGGASEDGTLRWDWGARPDGSRVMLVHLWNGEYWDLVIADSVEGETE